MSNLLWGYLEHALKKMLVTFILRCQGHVSLIKIVWWHTQFFFSFTDVWKVLKTNEKLLAGTLHMVSLGSEHVLEP